MDCKPKLRFPEFSGGLKSEEVNKLFLHVRNGFVGTATPYYVEKGVPYLQSNNIRRNKIDKRKIVYINDEFHEKNKKSVLKKGDILMVQSGHAGECAVVTDEFNNANCHALVVMTPTKQINSDFCAYYMNSSIGKNQIHKLITGQTVNHILASDLKKYRIKSPTLTEQNKIASFLLKVESKIEKLEKKQELWETYKKGIMQQIFSQKLRFKDENGEDYPDWEEKKLKSISSEVKRISKTVYEEVLTISAGKGFISQKERWNKVIAGNSLKKYVLLRKNEFSYNRGNSKRFPYGCIYKLDQESALVPNVYRSFSVNQCPDFYAQFFAGGNLNRQLIRIISSSARMDGLLNISKVDFFRVKVPVPLIQEQEKIGTFLVKIDDKIDIVKKELEINKKFKKGLLQQMFC